MKTTNYGADHPHAVVRGRVAGIAATGTATLTTLNLVVITPTALAANTDNWNPTGLSTADIIRASASAAYNLTGIVAPGDDRIIILDNIGSFAITLQHDVTSTAANRFLCPNDADLALGPDTDVWLQYDLASARWRVIGGTSSGLVSPLTTKGDLWGWTTTNARVAVGSNGQVLTADTTAGAGVSWQTPSPGLDTSAWQHAHIENVVYSGDGTTTVFTLPVACVDATSVDVYIAGSRSLAWVLSGTMFDTLTFDSAPASASNNIVVDIVTPIV